jgi:Tannase and feruloyl esterase
MGAQRFPEDFDGIIVGSPANFWTHLLAGNVWNEQALLDDPASYIPSALLPVLSNAARAQCAGQDGGVKTDLFLNAAASQSVLRGRREQPRHLPRPNGTAHESCSPCMRFA